MLFFLHSVLETINCYMMTELVGLGCIQHYGNLLDDKLICIGYICITENPFNVTLIFKQL